MVETRSSQIHRAREEDRVEPSNARGAQCARDPPIGPQNWPDPEGNIRDQERVSMTRVELADLVETVV